MKIELSLQQLEVFFAMQLDAVVYRTPQGWCHECNGLICSEHAVSEALVTRYWALWKAIHSEWQKVIESGSETSKIRYGVGHGENNTP